VRRGPPAGRTVTLGGRCCARARRAPPRAIADSYAGKTCTPANSGTRSRSRVRSSTSEV
jgi:hypothetical protein